jgi:N4-(beta-N-acetylglucosaminyl)-L-asparaginase
MPDRDRLTRRTFLGAATAASAALLTGPRTGAQPGEGKTGTRGAGGPIAIASGNGLGAVSEARSRMVAGDDPLGAAVRGVKLVEDDPEDMTVGLGGLPNEEGVVELDSSVMHGPTHRAGAVAALRNIRNPSSVALEVARRTDHVLLVGEGALRFARRVGFVEEDLTTEASRAAWLTWRATLSRDDDWLERDEFDLPASLQPPVRTLGDAGIPGHVLHTHGTIHCSALDAHADLGGVTTTSGLSWKLPGRVGDSPIIGAGLYTDNAIGSAGATGRGEAVIQVCGARTVVMRMEQGNSPLEACLWTLRLIAAKTRAKRLLDEQGRPNFNVSLYALRKDGAYASASLAEGRTFTVCDANGAREEASVWVWKS